MQSRALVVAVFTVVLGIGLAAQAVEPAYTGPLGNPEEPALRPFKSFWQGIKALAYFPAKAFENGNSKTAVLGSAETTRGLREGIIELGEHTVRGVKHGIPERGDEYREIGSVNDYLTEDATLRNAADCVAGMGICWAIQKGVDRYPAQNEQEREARKRAAQAARVERERKAASARAEQEMFESDVERARKRYLGDRYTVREKPMGEGNLLRLAP